MPELPIRVDEDLIVSVRRGSTRLSPGEALDVAETLIRLGTRRMIAEESAVAKQRRPR